MEVAVFEVNIPEKVAFEYDLTEREAQITRRPGGRAVSYNACKVLSSCLIQNSAKKKMGA